MVYQDEFPENMLPKELDARYGEPKKMPSVVAILGVTSNLNHDRVTVEILDEAGQRRLVPFSQSVLRQFIELCAPTVEGNERPKAN